LKAAKVTISEAKGIIQAISDNLDDESLRTTFLKMTLDLDQKILGDEDQGTENLSPSI
jgi:hypothetical protein